MFGGFEIKQFAEVQWGKQPQKDACYCRKKIVVLSKAVFLQQNIALACKCSTTKILGKAIN